MTSPANDKRAQPLGGRTTDQPTADISRWNSRRRICNLPWDVTFAGHMNGRDDEKDHSMTTRTFVSSRRRLGPVRRRYQYLIRTGHARSRTPTRVAELRACVRRPIGARAGVRHAVGGRRWNPDERHRPDGRLRNPARLRKSGIDVRCTRQDAITACTRRRLETARHHARPLC